MANPYEYQARTYKQEWSDQHGYAAAPTSNTNYTDYQPQQNGQSYQQYDNYASQHYDDSYGTGQANQNHQNNQNQNSQNDYMRPDSSNGNYGNSQTPIVSGRETSTTPTGDVADIQNQMYQQLAQTKNNANSTIQRTGPDHTRNSMNYGTIDFPSKSPFPSNRSPETPLYGNSSNSNPDFWSGNSNNNSNQKGMYNNNNSSSRNNNRNNNNNDQNNNSDRHASIAAWAKQPQNMAKIDEKIDKFIQRVRIHKDPLDTDKTIVKVPISQYKIITGQDEERLNEIRKMSNAEITFIPPDNDSCIVEIFVSKGPKGQPTSVTNAIWLMNIAINAYCKRDVSLAPFDGKKPLQEAVVSGVYGEPPGIKEAEISKSHQSHADAWGASNGLE